MKTAIIKVEYKDHTQIVLTNKHGDTYTSESESLMDFFCNADEYISPEQPKWIPVTERLPEQNSTVIVSDGVKVSDSWFGKRTSNDELGFRFASMLVTHWMPLPEPPNHERTN